MGYEYKTLEGLEYYRGTENIIGTLSEENNIFVEKIKSLEPIEKMFLPYNIVVYGDGTITIPSRSLHSIEDTPMISVEIEAINIARSVATYNHMLKIRNLLFSYGCNVNDQRILVAENFKDHKNSNSYDFFHDISPRRPGDYLLKTDDKFLADFAVLLRAIWTHNTTGMTMLDFGQAYGKLTPRHVRSGSSSRKNVSHRHLIHIQTCFTGIPASPPYLGWQYSKSSPRSVQRHKTPLPGTLEGLDFFTTVGEKLPPANIWESFIANLNNDVEQTSILAHLSVPGLAGR